MNNDRILQVPIDQIEIGENIRQSFDENELKGLAVSIRENGILIPLELVPGEAKPYRVFDGARRFAAAKLLNLPAVPARLRDRRPSEGERLQEQIVINAQRCEPKPTDMGRAINGHMVATGVDAGTAGQKCGFSNAKVSRYRKILKLEDWIQELVDRGQIAITTAGALADIEDPERRAELARQAANGQLTRDEAVIESKRKPQAKAGAKAAASAAKKSSDTETESSKGAVAPKRASQRFKFELPDGWILVGNHSPTPDSFIGMLSSLLARAQEFQSAGLEADEFFRALQDLLKNAA